jgi:ATP-binding cassette subfamily B protein
MSEPTPTIKAVPKSTAGQVLKLYWQSLRPYVWWFCAATIAIAISAVLQVYVPIYYRKFFDTLTTASDPQQAGPILIGIIVNILLLNGLIWLSVRIGTVIQHYFQSRIMSRLKQNAFGYLIHHSYSFFTNSFTGALTQRVNRFGRSFDRLGDRFLWTLVPLSIGTTGIIIVIWQTISPIISLVIIGWIIAFIVFNYFFSRWKVKYDIANAEIDSRATGLLSDSITNQNNIQLFTGESYEERSFTEITSKQASATTLSWNLEALVGSVQSAITFLAEFLLFYFAIQLWQQGKLTIGAFVLIQTYFVSLWARMWDISRYVRDIYESFADAKEMADIILQPHEIKDVLGAKLLQVSEGKIDFNDVIFSFNQTRTVLDTISVHIKGGEKVALIGPSGAGKSTFIRLLLRLYDVAGGAITIDDQNIKEVTLESLRQNLSLVPQDPILFHRSLKENIRYGRRDAIDEEVIQAGKLAHCDEFIKDLPLGYDTLVGERGIKLSGGERQRVAIARAILKNAPILILDEATSSLDSESESYIQDALDTLMRAKTVIVIAHRLSTIRKMDRIIVIDQGKILEEGSHDTLLQKEDSLYRKLWNLQAGGFLVDKP